MKAKNKLLEIAAKAAGKTKEEFAASVRNILRRRGCRDTQRVFDKKVMDAISNA